jgi:hypothetical protein
MAGQQRCILVPAAALEPGGKVGVHAGAFTLRQRAVRDLARQRMLDDELALAL